MGRRRAGEGREGRREIAAKERRIYTKKIEVECEITWKSWEKRATERERREGRGI